MLLKEIQSCERKLHYELIEKILNLFFNHAKTSITQRILTNLELFASKVSKLSPINMQFFIISKKLYNVSKTLK